VNQVKINIGKVEVLELLVKGLADMFLLVVNVPQLGGDCTREATARVSILYHIPSQCIYVAVTY
jgi:hypothetical protein